MEGGGHPVGTPGCAERVAACRGSGPPPAAVCTHAHTPVTAWRGAGCQPGRPGLGPPLGLGANVPAGSEVPHALPRDEPSVREAGGFAVPTVAQAGPTALQCASAPRGTARRAFPGGLRPFEPREPWAPAWTRGARSGPGCGAECGWRVALEGTGEAGRGGGAGAGARR